MAETGFRPIDGGLLAPEGFVASATAAGIKPEGLDMMLLHSQAPASAAATITTNRFRAAPTYVTERNVADGTARTVIVNSGNANAATGPQGMAAAERMAELAAEATGVPAAEALVCSTGRIGIHLPMDRVEAAIPRLAEALSPENAHEAARAIMTTDTVPKECAVELELGGKTVRIGGAAKGAGMILPNMATMLCFVCTDAAIEASALGGALREAVARSFNCISVDGDMSTNDTVIALANGRAGNATITDADGPDYQRFAQALTHVAEDLAKKIARDGEGSSKFVAIRVTGGDTWHQARDVGRAVSRYNLVKTCIFGEDFNWGRIAAAVGASGVPVDPARCSIAIGGITAFSDGQPVDYDREAAAEVMTRDEIEIHVDLGMGDAEAVCWTCDMTPEYVKLNAH